MGDTVLPEKFRISKPSVCEPWEAKLHPVGIADLAPCGVSMEK